MYKPLVLMLAALLAIPAAAMAEQPRAKESGKRLAQMMQALDLNDQQIEKMRQLRHVEQRQSIELRSKLQLAQLDFHEELQKDKPDRAKLDKLIATIVTARADMERQRLTMQVEMSQILTPDQRKRMMRHMGERMMEHRPGMDDDGDGPGGPPSGHGAMKGPMMR